MSSAIASPVEHIAQAACELMRDRERCIIRCCAGCGSLKPRLDENRCPDCGQETDILCANLSRVR